VLVMGVLDVRGIVDYDRSWIVVFHGTASYARHNQRPYTKDNQHGTRYEAKIGASLHATAGRVHLNHGLVVIAGNRGVGGPGNICPVGRANDGAVDVELSTAGVAVVIILGGTLKRGDEEQLLHDEEESEAAQQGQESKHQKARNTSHKAATTSTSAPNPIIKRRENEDSDGDEGEEGGGVEGSEEHTDDSAEIYLRSQVVFDAGNIKQVVDVAVEHVETDPI